MEIKEKFKWSLMGFYTNWQKKRQSEKTVQISKIDFANTRLTDWAVLVLLIHFRYVYAFVYWGESKENSCTRIMYV